MNLEKAKQEALAQVDAQSGLQFELAMRRINLIGALTNWRKMKSPHRVDKILNGRAKILSLIGV
tara:strand:- start:12 stop:203 length:192 start_codon:yes stop_codon:yes gene_type:complete